MADTQSNIQVNIDTTQALASIKNLQRQISAFHSSMAKGGAAANAVSAQMQQTLINSINSTGKFAAQIKTIKTTTESFTSSLEKNKFSLGEYFRYAGGASKTFGKLFKTEFDTINKVARENVKDLQTQYIRMGRDASGAMKAIAVRPLSLDMNDLATKTMIASEKQALLNQLLKQGSTNLLNFGKNTQWAGRQLMVGFTLPLIALGSAASKTFMDMETEAIRFKKVYGDLFTPQEESKQALQDIQDLGREFTKYGISVSSTVGLAAEAAAAGFQGVDLQRQTAAATKLSILGQVESQKALETTISLQNAFSMSSENLAESIDFLNAVENQTVLSLDDMSTAIPKAAPVVQQLGGNVKDLAFLMTAMKEGGINASEGANALKSGLASLINPTGKANDMLLSFGINAKEIVLQNKGDLKKTVIEFATALNMLDPLNRAQAIEQMFGKFQFARLSTLFANVTKEGTQASRVLDLAGASVQELAALSEKELGMTSESAMNKFKGAVENLKLALVPVGEEFLKAVTPIAEFITKILDRFNNLSDGTKKIIVTMTAVIAGLGPVFLMTFGLLANGIANIIKGFTLVKSVFNKTSQSTTTLGTQVEYMTLEQRNAAAVAASLDQVHKNLAQTFTSEATAVNSLTQAYQRAIAAQAAFMPTTAPIGRGPIKKRAKGKPAVVGGIGNQDSELALLMPGETVIPTDMSKKYGNLINGMISDNIPGYMSGKSLAFAHASMPFAPGSAQFAEGIKTAGLENLIQEFPNMVKVVSNLVAEIPQEINVAMQKGVSSDTFASDYSSRTGKFLSSGILGGLDAGNQQEVVALQKLEDEIGTRTISMARASKEQKVTDALFAKATRDVIDEYLKLDGAVGKAAKALDTSSKQVGQVRVSATQAGLRSGLEKGIFRRTRKATQTQNQVMFGEVNVGRESASNPGTFYSGNPITPKGAIKTQRRDLYL
jgi:TP901 family phage tail tape measure protein